MKSDLDRLMSERGYDALLVTGASVNNPPMYYLANGAKVGEITVLVKPRGRPAVIFANSMEREEAARSGLEVVDQNKYGLVQLLKEEKGDRRRAVARQIGLMLADAHVRGTVAAYGTRDQGAGHALLSAIEELHPDLRIVGEFADTVLDLAMATKDAAEVKRIRAAGRKTVKVVAATEEFLLSHRAEKGVLVKKDGSRLTVGDVKGHIRQSLLQQGVVDAEDGPIFAIGRDGGVPHARGTDRDPNALGKPIVFDIFPNEAGGGYFYDFTRTWCLGYAPPEVEKAYADVLAVFQQVVRALKPGELCRAYQKMTCDLLEARGHPTIQSQPQTTSGYVHSLGHGIGLRVHESPRMADVEGNNDRLDPGAVFTVEPGVYYPERGFGIRIEDSLWLNPDTLKFETLANYSKRLVLPVKQAGGRKKAAGSPRRR